MRALFILLTTLTLPVCASTINIDINGTLGPLLAGSDPLNLAGDLFSAQGSFTDPFTLISGNGSSATYNVPGDLQIQAGNFDLTGYNATLTITDPSSGPDTLTLAFTIIQVITSPQAAVTISLPAGTFGSDNIQNLDVTFSQPDSNLLYSAIGNSAVVSGELGITGAATVTGAGPSGAQTPEPGTLGIVITSLLACAIVKHYRQCPGK